MPNIFSRMFSIVINSNTNLSEKVSLRTIAPEVRQLCAMLSLAATRHDQVGLGQLAYRHRRASRLFRITPRAAQVPASFLRNDVFFPDPWWSSTELKRDSRDETPIETLRDGTQLLSKTQHKIALLDGRNVVHERLTLLSSEGKRFKLFSATFDNGKRIEFDDIPYRVLPLYGIEALAEEGNGSVIICEGVPATDALKARGFRAVGTLTGAFGTPSRDALKSLLPEKEVMLWPDNDSLGIRHMERTARRLSEMGVEAVRIVRWIGAPRKADAANFQGTDEELNNLIASARPWSLQAPISNRGVLAINPRQAPHMLRLDAGEAPPQPSSTPPPAVTGAVLLTRKLRAVRAFTERLSGGETLSDEERNRMMVLLDQIENTMTMREGDFL